MILKSLISFTCSLIFYLSVDILSQYLPLLGSLSGNDYTNSVRGEIHWKLKIRVNRGHRIMQIACLLREHKPPETCTRILQLLLPGFRMKRIREIVLTSIEAYDISRFQLNTLSLVSSVL